MAVVAQIIAAANAHFHPGILAVKAGVLGAAVLSEVACADVAVEFMCTVQANVYAAFFTLSTCFNTEACYQAAVSVLADSHAVIRSMGSIILAAYLRPGQLCLRGEVACLSAKSLAVFHGQAICVGFIITMQLKSADFVVNVVFVFNTARFGCYAQVGLVIKALHAVYAQAVKLVVALAAQQIVGITVTVIKGYACMPAVCQSLVIANLYSAVGVVIFNALNIGACLAAQCLNN